MTGTTVEVEEVVVVGVKILRKTVRKKADQIRTFQN